MAYTQDQIDRIHQRRIAKYGKIYKAQDGVLYTGSKKGHLIQESPVSGDASGTTLRLLIENIGSYTTIEVIEILESVADKLDKDEFEEYKKEAKCFTIAMSVAL